MLTRNNITSPLRLFFIALPLFGFLAASCSDFLKEEDKDKVIPRTMDQFEAMLHKEGFCDVSWFYRSEFMTDDVSENTNVITTAKNHYKSIYTWQYDIERTGDGNFSAENNDAWGKLYNDILVANYVLERSKDIVDAETMASRRNYLDAEAHFLRARAYLELANIYAPPYNPATAENTPGVPLRSGTGVTNTYTRSSIAAVYRQIVSDLNDAIALFDNSTEQKSLWHPNKKAALLLLSRTYLYMCDWNKASVTATQLINLCPQGLYAMNRNITDPVVQKSNPEILHTWGIIAGTLVDNESEGVMSEVPKIYRVDGSLSTAAYGVSEDLMKMYSENDVRPLMFFKSSGGTTITAKWHPQYTSLGGYTYRLVEAYLNRAEAYAAMENIKGAMDDIETILAKRIDGDYTSLLPASTDPVAVRRFVLDQRRMELCFENHRWYDLRRTQSWYPKDITHTFSYSTSTSGYIGTVSDAESFTLRSSSPNYTLELPLSETTVNPSISLYGAREEITPFKP